MELREWVKLQEELLKAQLTVLRRHLADTPEHREAVAVRTRQRMSQMSMVIDILAAAGGPLHIHEIIRRAEAAHGAKLDRESLVSAMAKKVRKGVVFERVSPNTFGLRKR